MVDPARARKLAKRIGTIVATAIDHEIKDPRLAYVTVTDTKVTNDLHDATVYYTVMGADLDTPPDLESAAAGLEKAKGVLRSKVGAGTGVRFTPTLTFVADTVPDTARHMEELLARTRAADDAVARAAAGAAHAGDADPYKAPRDDQDDEGDDASDALGDGR
ncbi:30S ribosome-binding factor RbfA [Rhodococcus triatomae]|uniref:Ribosome-binding factor A n=1 Tax=Rhodococcus triatomae TaxID=300028 RepID=A0A1G8Q8I5_9NOCA|nr:30S ribosome-binding factor RbfA [Rhodococcus triatomae]QNG19161.1 30S ribosome-binding factor RbfA [Rhodococcus triatomae]QNG24927.1 30S ribosome-binding factor RbfA [Rhodococcus triatomae]SDJ00873.1 ribosome-binding factor A [Rhodococcus triatomae]